MLKNIYMIVIMFFFISCGGNSSQNDENKTETLPEIVKKTNDITVENISKNDVQLSFKAKDLHVKNYILFIEILQQQRSIDFIDLNEDCKKISSNMYKCLILAKKDTLKYNLNIKGLEAGKKYVLSLQVDENENTSKDENETIDDMNESITEPIVKPNKSPIAIIKSNNIITKNQKITFDASDSKDEDGNITKYQWFENNKLISEKKIFQTSFKNIGRYTITLKVFDDKDAVGISSIDLHVKDDMNESITEPIVKPKIINVMPEKLEKNVTINPALKIYFNKAIKFPDKSKFYFLANQTKIDLKDAIFTLDETKTILTIRLDKDLYENTNYILYGSFNDLSGNEVINDKILDFITEKLEYSNINFNLTAWDDNSEKIKISAEIENAKSNYIQENFLLDSSINGKLRVQKGKKYKINMLNNIDICKPSQNVGIEKISNGEDININIDCKADVYLKASINELQTLNFIQGKKFIIWNTSIFLDINNKKINSDKLKYSSTDETIATVDNFGIVTLKKAGFVSIKVAVNPSFYNGLNEVKYDIKLVQDDDIIIQDIQMGQTTILSTDDKYFQLAAGKETIIRAYMYSNKQNVITPKTTISFTNSDGTEFSKDMICPKFLHFGKINDSQKDGYNYNISDTCYAIMATEDEKAFISPNIKVTIQADKKQKIVTPAISHKRYLNVYLIKGKTTQYVYDYPRTYIASVSNEDVENIGKFLLDTYPVSEVNIRVREEPYKLNIILKEALTEVSELANKEKKPNEYIYAIIPADIQNTDNIGMGNGLSLVGRPISVGRNKEFINGDDDFIRTLAHELGHAFGLLHSPCGLGIGSVDNYWSSKYSNNWENETKGYLSKSPVYVPSLKTVANPYDNAIKDIIGSYSDLMGYCSGHRLTKHFYKLMSNYYMKDETRFDTPNYDKSVKISSRSFNDKNEYNMVFQGQIKANSLLLNPVSITSNGLDKSFSMQNFGYFAMIKNGKKTISYPLEIMKVDHNEDVFFRLILPLQKIDNLKFFHGNKEIQYTIKRLKNNFTKKQKSANITFKNGVIAWNFAYAFMDAVFISDEKNLIVNKAKGGKYKLQKELNNGILEVSVSDGINVKIKRFYIK